MKLVNGYLVLYNAVQAAGWALALISISRKLQATGKIDGTYAAAGQDVSIMQGLAFLEVLHAATGMVRSGVLTNFIQWFGRSHVLYAVLNQVPEIQKSPAVFAMFGAWALSEVIRYPQYALSIVDSCPFWLTWLRYTAFIVLYPIGVFLGEMYLVYEAIPYGKKKGLYNNVFNHLPFKYDTFLMVLLIIYPLPWLQLYLHMLKQRKSKLKGTTSGKAKEGSRRSKRE